MAQKIAKELKVYNVHAGHNPDGKTACGACCMIKESTEAREVKDKVITMLKILGKTVYDCTVNNGTSQNDVLQKIVAKCNAHKADIDISIHFNSGRNDKKGDGSTGGVEVFVYPCSSVADIAGKICNGISDALGIRNRGVKESDTLYVLRKTNASAMLIEVCFVDDKDDVDKYNSTKAAEAIVYAITGVKYKYGDMQETAKTDSSAESEVSEVEKGYLVRVTADVLNVRKGAGTSYDTVTQVEKGEVYTIVSESDGWGKLKSGAGWISLKYTEKV